MILKNKGRKIIAINGEALLPGKSLEAPDSLAGQPNIKDMIQKGVLHTDGEAAPIFMPASNDMSEEERLSIERAAVEKYIAQQKEYEKQAEKTGATKSVKSMNKPELLEKAAELGLEVDPADTVDILKEKILSAMAEASQSQS